MRMILLLVKRNIFEEELDVNSGNQLDGQISHAKSLR